MATYVNDLRLTELATGEGSGTWGTTTNVNLELIGEALGYGTQDCFASDADATTTVADGATDPARAMYFKVTSSATLTATRTLTIAPNTVSRVMLIENATTGSQSIAISQGSGGNVTIASGQTKMVYLDGAGSGGAVVDALADLELGTITVADLTATTADINGGTIDGVTIGGSSAGAGTFTTLSATTGLSLADDIKATFGTSTELEIYYNSSATVNLIDSPSASIQMGANSIQLGSYGGSPYAVFDNTGVDVTGTVTADSLTTNEDQSGLLTLGRFSSGFAYSLIRPSTNATGLEIRTHGGNATARFLNNGVAELYNNASKKLETTATGIDVTGTVTADGLTVTAGGSSAILIQNSQPGLVFDDNSAVGAGSDKFIIRSVAGQSLGDYELVMNNDQTSSSDVTVAKFYGNGDISFYEDTGTTPKFFWDASAEALGIGTSSPSTLVEASKSQNAVTDVKVTNVNTGTAAQARFTLGNSGSNFGSMGFLGGSFTTSGVYRQDGAYVYSNGAGGLTLVTGAAQPIYFAINNSEKMRIDSSGNLLVGTTDSTESGDNGWVFFPDGAAYSRRDGTSSAPHFRFYNNADVSTTQVGNILSSGSSTSYNTSSDARLKENIADAEDAGAKVDAIQVRQFDWKADGSHQDYGMVAQELLTVAPEAVSGDPESDDMMGVDYSKLVPMMLKEIQSLRARVHALEGK